MKYSVKIPKVLLACIMFIAITSCDIFDQKSRVYDGPTVVEFFPLSMSVDEGDGAVTVEIQLIGPQRSSPLDISWSVDSANSTAVAGDDYSISTPTTVTIPANSSETTITIDVLSGSSNPAGNVRQLILLLEGGQGVDASANLDTHTLSITGV